MAVEQVVRRCQGRGGYSRQEQSPDPYPARSCEIPLAQSRRALVQQAQELAPRRHTIWQNQRILSRLRQPCLSIPVVALCPRPSTTLAEERGEFCWCCIHS